MTPDEALDKKAENARELELDYEPDSTWIGIAPEEYPDVRYQRETYYAGIKWAEDRLREKNT